MTSKHKKTGENGGLPPLTPGVDYINPNKEDQAEIYGFERSWVKTTVTWFFIITTLGLLRLVFHWIPKWMVHCTHTRCSLQQASKVLVVDSKYDRNFLRDVYEKQADKKSYDLDQGVLNKGFKIDGADGGSVIGGSEKDGVTGSEHQLQDMNLPSSLAVPMKSGKIKEVLCIRVFTCKKVLYLWDPESLSFYRLQGLESAHTPQDLHKHQGLPWTEQVRRRIIYGENLIKVPLVPLCHMIFLEALNPFYIFQVFSVCLWYCDDYEYYATVIVVVSLFSLFTEVKQTYQNQKILRSTIQTSDTVQVVRNDSTKNIPSKDLVPGDLISISPRGCILQCDAVILQGECIVNESMLTGESVPVTKTTIEDRSDITYTQKEHNRHTLFCGTEVIQTRVYGDQQKFIEGKEVVAVVVRTGFMTEKGSLVRSIMYPPPVDFKFQQDSYKFIGVLAGIAFVGFIYTVITKHMRGLSASEIALDSLDLITIVIPPALPMAMTVGILYALRRLKNHKIFCISPRTINICGVIDCICFDKTGTLTEDGLDMKGVVPVTDSIDSNRKLSHMILSSKLPNDHLLYGMATCHSITVFDVRMIGDPLDLKMFESTNWVLEEPGLDITNSYEIEMPSIVRPTILYNPPVNLGRLHQFPFSSNLQRMSVVICKIGAQDRSLELYCKGSPEMIVSLSRTETVPVNFSEELMRYTQEGYRVLALGWRLLEYTKYTIWNIKNANRDEIECDLEFLGLLVMENKLKEETKPILTELHQANIKTIMVTGDNILTAVTVGRECGLVGPKQEVITIQGHPPHQDVPASLTYHTNTDNIAALPLVTTEAEGRIHINLGEEINNNNYCFAVEGKSWAVVHTHFPDVLQKLLVRGAVFARMSPDQKQQLVLELQALGYYVSMCGDGANDCGALKAAHAGISLSEAEASVASPFTSAEPNISCVPILIREGRCALVTSFGVFKYMAAYSLTQFVSVMFMYSIDGDITDIQYLWIDLFLITVFAIFFGHTGTYKGPLASYSPPAALLSLTPILSIIIHMVNVIGFQTFCFFYVQTQPWFVPFNPDTSEEKPAGYENYAVVSISLFQYIALAIVFSRGPPFRKHFYTNWLLTGSILFTIACCLWITLGPAEFIVYLMELIVPPSNSFRWQIILFALLYSATALFIEYVIIDYLFYRKCRIMFHNIDKSKKKYLAIERDLQQDKTWPLAT